MKLINDTLVNLDNVCTMKRYYRITKDPMISGVMKDDFRLYITFTGGKSETIYFDNAEQMDSIFNSI